jgi:predicted nucleotidyltransferase
MKRLLHLLVESHVDFIVVGGLAAMAYGAQYQTQDLDICYERTRSNYKHLMAVLQPLHAKLVDVPADLKVPFDESSLTQGTNFTLMTDEGRLDLLGELSGVGGYRELLPNSIEIEVAGTVCSVASLEQIIRSKEAANRPKDQLVLPELRALLEARKRLSV